MTVSEYRMFRMILRKLWTLSPALCTELARSAGVNPSTLRRWKEGETLTPRLDTLSRVARELGYNIVLEER